MSCTQESKDIEKNVHLFMQNAHLNSGTSIFKVRILAQFVSHDFLK